MKNKIIAGNWKMNKTAEQAERFCRELLEKGSDAGNKVVIFVPFTDLSVCAKICRGSFVSVGAQNVHWEQSGAFTGEISVEMLREAGAEYVLVGHSERRALFGETNETVAKRTAAALQEGLKAMVCVGETLSQREQGLTEDVLRAQLKAVLCRVDKAQMKDVCVAYEPVWAIGTGKTASAEQACRAIAFLRGVVGEIFDGETAGQTYLLYGGSMNEKNAFSLLEMQGIDGGLIGGASLDADKFISIIRAYDNSGKNL